MFFVGLLHFMKVFTGPAGFNKFVVVALFVVISSFTRTVDAGKRSSPRAVASIFSPVVYLVGFIVGSACGWLMCIGPKQSRRPRPGESVMCAM